MLHSLQEQLSYSVLWQLVEPRSFALPDTTPCTATNQASRFPGNLPPVQAAAAMLQQLQKQLLNQPDQTALQIPCLSSESAASLVAMRSSSVAPSAAAMAAVMRVASSETQGTSWSMLAASHLVAGTEPHAPVSLSTSSSSIQPNPLSPSAGVHGREVTDGALWLPQICPTILSPASKRPSGQPFSAASEVPDSNFSLDHVKRQQGHCQDAFVTGGLGALGQLLAMWLHESEGAPGLDPGRSLREGKHGS